jgi:thioredoxin-related protein
MKTLLVSLLFLLSGPVTDWKLDFKAAKTEAATTHKMILLNFSGSDWCGPCIKLKKDVFESPEFEAFAGQNLVLVRADFPRQKKNQLPKEQVALNEALAEQYNPKGSFPLTVLLDENGKVVKEWEGYQASVPVFIAEISKAGAVK